MMTQQSVEITFPDVSPDVANSLAESLAEDIRGNVKDGGLPVDPEIIRTDPTAQDFGTTLTILLGTPAVIILANAVRDWARRTNRSDVIINGKIIKNLESKDVADVVKAMNSNKE
jgi:hypothetical protein